MSGGINMSDDDEDFGDDDTDDNFDDDNVDGDDSGDKGVEKDD